MNYMLLRDGQQYGPYTLADLQRYVATGNILITDLVKSEGMENWVPLSQVIGNIPVPVAPVQQPAIPMGSAYPAPPDLHWGILLAINIVTCGLFSWAWIIVEAAWLRKVQPASKGLIYAILAACLTFGGAFASGFVSTTQHRRAPLAVLVYLAGFVFWFVTAFSMKSSIEEHFNTAEPIGLRLSGVMTFFFQALFFNVYFQYHFTEINRAKKAQQLSFRQYA